MFPFIQVNRMKKKSQSWIFSKKDDSEPIHHHDSKISSEYISYFDYRKYYSDQKKIKQTYATGKIS